METKELEAPTLGIIAKRIVAMKTKLTKSIEGQKRVNPPLGEVPEGRRGNNYILIGLSVLMLVTAISFACKKLDLTRQMAIKTIEVSNITTESATVQGEIIDLGEGIIDHGVYYHTEPNAQNGLKVSLNKSTGVGGFTTIVEGLQAGITYYTRTFGFDGTTYVYGEEKQFTALDGIATITTDGVENITAVSAICSGAISESFGNVVERGICYSISSNPTLVDLKIKQGSGTGEFTCSISELTINTTYYVRAYATNSGSTVYGNQQTFTTQDGFPVLTTKAVTGITTTTATSGGNITSDGGYAITVRGISWGTSSNPTIADNKNVDGSGTGNFRSSLTGLTENTTYYVRAFATNSIGTKYGQQESFVTNEQTEGTLTDIDGNSYKWVKIGNQTWMAENLKTTHYPNGNVIPLVTDNTTWGNLGDNNTDDAYCYYNNNANNEADTYGALYTYAAAKDACPTGWHLPSDAEWTTLKNYISAEGHNGIEGTTLKAIAGWNNNGNGTNNYDFSALPGGHRDSGSFAWQGTEGFWWSSTELFISSNYIRNLGSSFSIINPISSPKSIGLNIRCIKD
ncbi:MAG: fibrobacter succinogenes major paralogous domain-containing protein [Salinivirgaceae bacterium]|nr:fibrobacter succinogenes major paralogous domain-containing protein [Salinivirgaceae bacterium]